MVGMVEMVGEMERLTQWGEAALSSSEGEQASWERAWEEQKPWLHLSQDSDDKDCISLRMVMIQDCIKDGYNYVDEKDQIEGSNSKW